MNKPNPRSNKKLSIQYSLIFFFILEKRKRFMKNSKKKGPELTNEEIQFLTCNTRYDDKEVREWFRYIMYTNIKLF